jgi:uncharacterized RDD family membrane protein YckC
MDTEYEIDIIADLSYPSMTTRIKSIVIDNLLLILFLFLFSILFSKLPNKYEWIRGATILLFFFVYEPLAIFLGGTIGNRVMNISVKNFSNKKSINIFQSFFRFFVKIGLGWLSFLTIHSNPQKRAIHDKFSGTVMINN